ncbi:MAG: ATP-binding protein [Bacteroides sp.]
MGLIKKPSELEIKSNLTALIYGQPGIGKTTLGCSAPNAVLFDYDGGVQRINGAHQVPTVQIRSWEDTGEALKELEQMPEIETILIDTVGKMLDFMSKHIIDNDSKQAKRDGSLSLQGYGARKMMFISFIKQVSMMGKNIIFIAHEREEKRKEEIVKRPEIGGSSANDLIKELDLVGYMQAIGKERTLTFDPTEEYYAKNTCNLPTVIKLPTVVDNTGIATGENNFFNSIFDAYKKQQKNNIERTSEFEDLIYMIKEDINDVSRLEEINELTKKFYGFQHIYNSKIIAAKLLNEKAKSLGFVLNKATKQYEAA